VNALTSKIIQLEQRLFQPDVRASYVELDKLIADEFIEIAASGAQFGKKEALSRLPSEFAPKINAHDFELRLLAPNCVQLLYKATMIKQGETKVISSLRCSIWSEINGQWQMVYHQGTLC
jgi:hypothetical protein